MTNTLIVGSQRLYVVTPDGHAAALAEASCQCRWTLSMGMLVCTECATGVQLQQPSYLRAGAKHD
jgi:hypothetical protein